MPRAVFILIHLISGTGTLLALEIQQGAKQSTCSHGVCLLVNNDTCQMVINARKKEQGKRVRSGIQ